MMSGKAHRFSRSCQPQPNSTINSTSRMRLNTFMAAPPDTFAALGHWGQALYVIPSEKLLIVRYADDRDGSYRHNELLKRVLGAVRP